MPPDPPKWCAVALFNRPLKLSLCCVLPPFVIFSKETLISLLEFLVSKDTAVFCQPTGPQCGGKLAGETENLK